MVVQYILAVRKGRREVKVAPENKEEVKLQIETRTEEKSVAFNSGETNPDVSTKSEIISKDPVPQEHVGQGACSLKLPENMMDVRGKTDSIPERSEVHVDVGLSMKDVQRDEDKTSSSDSLKPSIIATSLCEEKPVSSKQKESPGDEIKLKSDRIREPLGVKEEGTIWERFKQDLVHTKPDVQYVEVEEYFVKYRNFSYLHCEWKTEDELFKGDKRISAKLKRFKQKMAHHANIFENVSYFSDKVSQCVGYMYMSVCHTELKKHLIPAKGNNYK
jgi:chromodomain-helicase-DNA-binding protein 7